MSRPHRHNDPRAGTPFALILGAGLSGLSVALGLLRRGRSVTILEKAGEVGGLARTVRVGAEKAFDLGGHRFYSQNQDILDEVRCLLDGELLDVPRRSRIFLDGHFFDYPLSPVQAVFSFGPRVAARILTDYLWAHFRSLLNRPKELTFEDWALGRFGKTLYRIFFKPYTEKVWGVRATELSAEWSRERIDLFHLLHALLSATIFAKREQPRTYASSFLYPRNGIGRISDRLGEEIEGRGGEILCASEIHGIERHGGRVLTVRATDSRGQERNWKPQQVVSTIPIPDWVRTLDPPPEPSVQIAADQLVYRNMIFVYLLLSVNRLTRDTWIYVPDSKIRVCRIHEPKNWSEALSPKDKTSLCVELFSSLEDDLWQREDDAIVALVTEEMKGIGLLDPSSVLESKVLRVSHTHPVYRVGFQRHFTVIDDFIRRETTNLHLLGRTGAFRYKNMDQVMIDGARLAERLDGMAGKRNP